MAWLHVTNKRCAAVYTCADAVLPWRNTITRLDTYRLQRHANRHADRQTDEQLVCQTTPLGTYVAPHHLYT